MSNALKMAEGGVTDPSTRAKTFDWLSRALEPNALGTVGGCIRLIREDKNGAPRFSEVRDWIIQPVAEQDIASVAGRTADEIIQEAEAYCEGRGGGTVSFLMRAFVQGQRGSFRERPFDVTLEESTPSGMPSSINPRDQTSVLAHQNAELHRTCLAHAQQSLRVIEALVKRDEQRSKLDADNYALLRANIENREGREADAWSTMQKTQMFKDFGATMITTLIPALIQYASPHVLPILVDWVSKPENQQAANSLFGLLANFAGGQQQPQATQMTPPGYVPPR